MAVMLNMTDAADGFPFTHTHTFTFLLYNQTLAHAVSEVFSGMLIAITNVIDTKETTNGKTIG